MRKLSLMSPVAIVLSWLIAQPGSGWASESLTLAIFDYPPFLAADDPDRGIEPALVRAAFAQAGVEVNYKLYPPARALELARQGKADGTLGWVRSEPREQAFYYSDELIEAPLVFFHLQSYAFDWSGYDDLQGIKVGTVIDYYYGEAFHSALDKGLINLDTPETHDELNLNKLVGGRIHVTPINLHVGYYLAHKHLDPQIARQITHHPHVLKNSVHHLLLPKVLPGSSSRLQQFNEGLEKIKISGEYQRILQNHGIH